MPTKTNLLDLVDFGKVDTLLEGFNKSTGFVTAILDLKGKVLSKSGWRQICTEFHRINPETSNRCRISDTVLANKMAEGEKYHFYECLNGLVDVAVPIVINGEHIANLFSGQFFFDEPDEAFFKKQAEKYGFDERNYLTALKNVPVISKEKVKVAMDFLLDMTQLISEITQQKSEQLQLNKALRKSEERSRNALDNLLEGCQIIGYDWRYIYLNHTAEIHNKRPNQELIGARYMDIWPGIEETEVFKIIKQTLETRVPNHFENEFIFPDGSIGWFDLSIQPVPEGVFILSIDITERKRVENDLRVSEEKYRLISDNSDDWIYWVTPDGKMKYVSPACERVTGYSPDEFSHRPELNQEIVFEADQNKVNQHHQYSKSDNHPHELEYRIVTKGGELRWISHSCSPIFSNNGEYLGRRGTNRNITERKRQEEQLYESEFRFGKLYENGPFGMVMADSEFRFKKVNPVFCAILGYSEEELLQFTFKDVSHPDDLPKDMANVRKLMNKEISVYKTDKRYIRKDGQEIWGSLTVAATYDSEGQFLYNLGIIEDITPRKQADEKIRELNERISTATRASQVGIWDWDIKNNLLSWDDQMYALYGLKKDEFAGAYEAWVNGLHPDDREFGQNETKLALLGEKEYDTEFRVVWPDGTVHYERAKGEVFRNEMGEPIRMVGINYDITEQKKIDQKIREKDQEFRKLSANVPDLIFQFTRKPDGTYYVPIASEGIRNIFGCAPEDVIDDFTPIGSVIYPEDAERVIRDIEYSAEHLTYFTCEFRVKIPGREIQWIYSKSTPERLPDGSITWYGFNTDITHRKLAEEALRESEEKFRKLIKSIPLPVAYVNSLGDITFRNDRFLQVMGYTSEEVPTVNEWWGKAYPNENYRKLVIQQWESAVEDANRTNSDIEPIEYNITCKDGIERTMIVSGIIIEDNLLITFIDITERKKAEKEVIKLNETLEQRVEERTIQLQEANKELEAFSYSVSHDLRAPLRHINGFVDLLKENYTGLLPEKGQHYLEVIVNSSRHMGTLIDDLLQFSRTGRQEMQKTDINMDVVIYDVLNSLEQEIGKRKIEWNITTLPTVKGDQSLLRMVWYNLLSNAIKFTRAKNPAQIEVGFADEKNEYTFFVRDNGAGFDMRFAHKLFGVFQRLHTAKEFEGTGIGLANVRRIILKHGGRTWAESKLNEGAAFYFSLPKPK